MKQNYLSLLGLALILHAGPIVAAEPEAGSTEKVYRDYTEAYQKAAQSYEKAAKDYRETYEKAARESQTTSYIIWTLFGVLLILSAVVVGKTRRAQKAYTDRALEISMANQKLLEEIRDLLKSGRT